MSQPSLADKRLFLDMAIAQAVRGARERQGGPFGAVVVKDGEVIAAAANAVVATNDPTAHAEVQAIRTACAALGSFQLDGCDIYASCEPCPMCLGAIFWARPRAVYYAATRAEAAAAGFDDAVFYQALAGDSALSIEMGTLGGSALHSAPATHPTTPSLRSASPNPPATLRSRQSRLAPHAIIREQVPCDDAGTPFAVYAGLPGRVRY
jgi:guanine deaminase